MRNKLKITTVAFLVLFLFTDRCSAQFISDDPILKKTGLTIYEFYNDKDTNALKSTIDRIDSLIQKEKYKQALAIVNNIIHNDSSFYPVFGYLAVINLALGNFDECVRACNYILNMSDLPELYIIRGIAYLAKEDFRHAKTDIDKVISLSDKYYFLYAIWGAYLASIGHCSEASEYCRLALKKNDSAPTWFYAAKYYLYCENGDSALYYVDKALDSLRNADVYLLRAQIKYELDDYNGYIENFDSTIRIIDRLILEQPDNIELFEAKYKIFISFSEPYLALGILDEMITRWPSAGLYMEKFHLAQNMGLDDKADSCINLALKMDSTNAEILFYLIDIYTELHNYEKVIHICNKIIQSTGDLYQIGDIAYAYRKRGNAKYLSGQKEEGCADIDKAASMGDIPAKAIREQTCNLIRKGTK